jgi:hypothetical protein
MRGQNIDFKVYSNPKVQEASNYKSANIYQKDALLFVDLLKECHPCFSHGLIPPVDLDSLQRVAYRWAATCPSAVKLSAYLESIAALLHDGHTTLIPNINMNLIYPFLLFNDGRSFYLQGVNQEFRSFLGKQVSLINGHSIGDVINGFRPLISSDNEAYFLDKVIRIDMPSYSMWQGHPYCQADSTLRFTFSDGSELTMHPVSRNKLHLVLAQGSKRQNTMRQNSKQPFLYRIDSIRSICYLQFDQCIDQSSIRVQYRMGATGPLDDALERRLARIPRFDSFLKGMFQDIKEKGIKTLVIDVRNNKGGDSRLCNVLLSWLKPIEQVHFWTSSIRFSNLWMQHYPVLANEYKQEFAKAHLPLKVGALYDNTFLSRLNKNEENDTQKMEDDLFVLNKDSDSVFKGTIIFIQNQRTYSSAGLLLTAAADNHIGSIIGSGSSYTPCSYGDLLGWILPNTKIRGTVSCKMFYRPDKSKCGASSLMPDVLLSPNWESILNADDLCWEWIVKTKY